MSKITDGLIRETMRVTATNMIRLAVLAQHTGELSDEYIAEQNLIQMITPFKMKSIITSTSHPAFILSQCTADKGESLMPRTRTPFERVSKTVSKVPPETLSLVISLLIQADGDYTMLREAAVQERNLRQEKSAKRALKKKEAEERRKAQSREGKMKSEAFALYNSHLSGPARVIIGTASQTMGKVAAYKMMRTLLPRKMKAGVPRMIFNWCCEAYYEDVFKEVEA